MLGWLWAACAIVAATFVLEWSTRLWPSFESRAEVGEFAGSSLAVILLAPLAILWLLVLLIDEVRR